ncbi:hypothetical protein GH714_002851 [Hevea brasiliensis]|uniref:Uncharacterized protein n=1 Tax=Hevea brasiliensis TaxID=3981 RepID=A0A6A6KZQ2_HEVBR|nr:hypothetical protein GH714_002851 [Hevea brasiliensis]
MEATVIDAGSKLLKAGTAIPDQAPPMIIPTQMKCMLEDGSSADRSLFEDANVDLVIGGFIRDWDAMEDLLHYVLYTSLEWAKGNEGQILFTDPLYIAPVIEGAIQHIASRRFEIGGFEDRFQKEASLCSSVIRLHL